MSVKAYSQRLPKIDKVQIADKILTGLFFAGFILPALLTSPFGLYAIVVGGAQYYFNKGDFHREAKRLQQRGYVAITKKKKGWVLKLLPKGRHYIKQRDFEKLTLPRALTWDRKWRLFSFDIPEELKNERNMLRFKLKSLGCYNIQRSLFAYPYDCRRELELVTEHYKVSEYTLFAEVSYIDIDKSLRKFYNL